MYPFDLQAGTPRSFEELEADLLRGQKLQGVLTSNEVQVCPCDLPCPGHSPLRPPPCCPRVSLTSGALTSGALAACCLLHAGDPESTRLGGDLPLVHNCQPHHRGPLPTI